MREEKDIQLKLRMMRYLWKNNYFVRHDVLLYNPYFDVAPQDVTDIDVYALKLDTNFSEELSFSECKSGRNVSAYSRLFWLSGLKMHYGANHAYFVKSDLNEEKYVDMGEFTGVTPLSENALTKLEESQNIDGKEYFGYFDINKLARGEDIFIKLKSIHKGLFYLIKFKYWNLPGEQQIKKVIGGLKELNNLKKSLNDETYNFLLVHLFTLLSISIMKCCKKAHIVPSSNRASYITDWIRGGRTNIEDTKYIASTFYDFMKSEFKNKCNYNYDVNKATFIELILNRPYFKDMVDVIERFCNNPKTAIYVPRILDILNYEVILGGNKFDGTLIPHFENLSSEEKETCIKLAKNIFVFANRQLLITVDTKMYLDNIF